MLDVKDEILESEELFQLEDKNGNVILDNVRIKMKTPILQEGTPLNKVLFDSIKNDILSRLKIEDKASTVEAQLGSDDVKYMTALKVLDLINAKALPSKQMSIKTGTISSGSTIPKTSGYSNYVYIVTPNNPSNNLDAYTDYADLYAGFRMNCSVNQSTRIVTATTSAFYYSNGNSNGWINTKTFSVNYLEIAWN